jgi:RNA polymerase sigma factor (sigma-70 family)
MEPMEASGLEAVLLANRPALLRFLVAHGAGDAAEDVLQELWVRVSAASVGPVAQPLAYLYRAANNLMLDRYRSVRQAVQRDRDWSDAGVTEPGRSDVPSGERLLIARQQLAQAEAVLDGLGERAAAIFRRHRLDGVRQSDIAAELGVSISTVESDLRRAYRAMIGLQREFDEG